MIFTLRTTVGQEQLIVDILSQNAKKENLEVYSVLVAPNLKGYLMIEADNELTVRRAIQNVPYIKGRGVVGTGGIDVSELSSLLESKPLMKSLKEGMRVEIIQGPFKGEKARILRINDSKEEVTVELLEAAVKIPVTLKAEQIIISKE